MSLSKDYVLQNSSFFKKTQFNTLYKSGKDLYKIFESTHYLDYLKNISYLHSISSQVNSNIILPNDLIIDELDMICGYKQPYIRALSLEHNLNEDIPINKKIETINKMSALLKEINQFLIVGDINLSNILLKKTSKNISPYLIDFDFSNKLDDTSQTFCLYRIMDKYFDKSSNSLNTDKIKMFISIISFLYGINYEEEIKFCYLPTLEFIINELKKLKNNGLLFDYAKYLIEKFNKNLPIDEYLFIPNNYNLEKEIEHGRKLIKKLS